jgi:hypothetical protein
MVEKIRTYKITFATTNQEGPGVRISPGAPILAIFKNRTRDRAVGVQQVDLPTDTQGEFDNLAAGPSRPEGLIGATRNHSGRGVFSRSVPRLNASGWPSIFSD